MLKLIYYLKDYHNKMVKPIQERNFKDLFSLCRWHTKMSSRRELFGNSYIMKIIQSSCADLNSHYCCCFFPAPNTDFRLCQSCCLNRVGDIWFWVTPWTRFHSHCSCMYINCIDSIFKLFELSGQWFTIPFLVTYFQFIWVNFPFEVIIGVFAFK